MSKYTRALTASQFQAILETHHGYRFDRPAPLLTERERTLAEAVLVEGLEPSDVARLYQASESTIYTACQRVMAVWDLS